MECVKTKLDGVILFKPRIFGDNRGFFYESYKGQVYRDHGLTQDFVQDNHSRSTKGVLRGLHYQFKHGQGKLVSVIRGSVFDVAVDIRPGSPTYGQWVGEILNDENHHQLYIPPGYAHGFYVISDEADLYYKCTDYYYPEYDAGVIWDDPDINIQWPLKEFPELSEKDKKHPLLAHIKQDKLPSEMA